MNGRDVFPTLVHRAVERGKIDLVDEMDRKILAVLQREGRVTITELATRVQLSVSPCHRRVQALEQSGTIAGYRAELDARTVGLGFDALVFVTMRESDRAAIDAFERAVDDVEQIVQAQRLFGDPDYLLRILCRDLAAFQQLYDERLTTLPGVHRLSSTLVMKSVVDNRPLPL